MDHSVAGYLRRQDTQKLEMLLESYMMEKSTAGNDILRIIREILKERNGEEKKKATRKGGCDFVGCV